MKKLILVGILMILLAVLLLPQDEPIFIFNKADVDIGCYQPSPDEIALVIGGVEIARKTIGDVEITRRKGLIHWWWLLILGIICLVSLIILFICCSLRKKQIEGLGNCINYGQTLINSQIKFIEYQEAIISECEEVIKEKNKALKTAQKTLEKIQKEN